jgi:hypothetical protein
MTEAQDRFWRLLFIGLVTAILFIGVGLIIGLPHPSLPIENVLLEEEREPFVHTQIPKEELPGSVSLSLNYFYHDSVPEELYEISWMADVMWQSTEQVFEGKNAARVTFKEPWSGVGVGSESANFDANSSIAFAVFIESGALPLYLELYNSNDGTVGRQALSRYFPTEGLATNTWQRVILPLADFAPTLPKNIIGFAVVAAVPGVVFLDDIQLLP